MKTDWSEHIIKIKQLTNTLESQCNDKHYNEAIDTAFDLNREAETLRWVLYDIKHPAAASARQHQQQPDKAYTL